MSQGHEETMKREPLEALPRRTFMKGSFLASGTALLSFSAIEQNASAQDEKKPDPENLQAEVDARMALIVARHGSKLDDAAKASIRTDVENLVKRGRTLKAVKLTNADEPAPRFRAYRGSED